VATEKIKFAAIGLNHGHVYAMIKGLLNTGKAECVSYFTEEPENQAQMLRAFPNVPLAQSESQILENPEIQLICSASINDQRASLAVKAMQHGKDFFVDKPGATTLSQLDEIERVQKLTGRSWFVWYSGRLIDPTSHKALELIRNGELGRIVNFIGVGPHKLNRHKRPAWAFQEDQYGGILNDLGIHLLDMFTHISGEKLKVVSSRLGNFGHPDLPTFQDFGDATLSGANGMTGYIRVDWFTPETMPTFGDIRNMIIGTKGMIELRKKVDLAVDNNRFTGAQLLLATHEKEPQRILCEPIESKFFHSMVQDVIEKQNRSVTHSESFAATRTALEAQALAKWVT
jgi:predicted dehydrogenase